MISADQVVIDIGYGLGRHGEAHALVARAFGINCRVDANDLSTHVHQWAAGVAGVDGGVGLNHGLELASGNDVAALGRDDSRGHSGVQPKGAANSQHPIAHLHGVRVA